MERALSPKCWRVPLFRCSLAQPYLAMKRYSRINCFVPLTCLILVFDNILLLQLSHPLDFIEVYYEALFVSMLWLDTLSTENREMVGTIEMLHPFRMYRAKFLTKHFFILVPHSIQTIQCPHGWNTTSGMTSEHTIHSLL